MRTVRLVSLAAALTLIAASQAPAAPTTLAGKLSCDVSGALSGTYTGVGAQASAGPGVGANVLVGGTGRAFSLQPISVQGQVRLNIAGGVTTVTLLPPPAK